MCRALATVLLLFLAGCGGRTGLGYDSDGGTAPLDASSGADAAGDGSSGLPADAGATDGDKTKSCAEVVLCIFDVGFDWDQMGRCTRGASMEGLSQAGDVIICLAEQCGHIVPRDGGQPEVVLCLAEKCQTELCACNGLNEMLPPDILVCPPP